MKKRRISIFFMTFAAAALLLSCNGDDEDKPGNTGGGPADWTIEEYRCADNPSGDALDRGQDDLGLPSAIIVKFNETGDAEVINPDFGEQSDFPVAITVNGGHVVVGTPTTRAPYNLILSGTTKNGSLKLYSSTAIRGFYLNGVNITNPRGPAINIQAARPMTIHLVGGCGRENYLEDGAVYGTPAIGADGQAESQKGTFFSEVPLTFTGSGYLEIKSKHNHALVVDASINIESGNITVRESANDGIHANADINITGGTVQVLSKGDGIQSERDRRAIRISGGKVRAQTTGPKSHGIAGEDSTIISGNADIRIHTSGNGSKGIRSRRFMEISGGTVDLTVTGGRDISPDEITGILDTSTAAGIRAGNSDTDRYGVAYMEISGGRITIDARRAISGKGINVAGDLRITGGTTTAIAHNDGIKTRGRFIMSAGTVTAKATTGGQDIDCEGRCEVTGGSLTGKIDDR